MLECSRIAWIIVLLLLCGAAAGQGSAWQGRPIQEYIGALAESGLNVIYSSDLLPADALIRSEPDSGDAQTALAEMLATYGLELRVDGNRLLVVPSACPPGRLLVRIIDQLTRAPVPGAVVTPGNGESFVADAAGIAIGRCLPGKSVRLRISATDYSDTFVTATPVPGGGRDVIVELGMDVEPISEIIVFSSVYSLDYNATGSHTFLERELTTRLPDVGDEALRALDRLPGTANGGVSTKTHVRGGADSEQLILLDGLRLYEPFHLKDFLSFSSVIDQRAIAGIDFYSAGYPARYGDRMSGVVDIGLREAPDQAVTELGVSLFNTSVLSTGRFGARRQGDWLVSARRGNLDLVARAFRPEYGSPLTEDLLAHAGINIGERVYLSANGLFSFDKITLSDGDDVEQARARYSNLVFWLKAEIDWTDRLTGSTILSITDISNERDGEVNNPGIVSGSVSDDREFQVVGLKQNFGYQTADNWSLRAGFDIKRMQATYSYESERLIGAPFDSLLENSPYRELDIAISPDGNQYAGYVEGRWRPVDWLVLDAGLRWDRQTYTAAAGDEQLSPRFNVLLDLGERSRLRLSAGRFYQAQEINELQIIDGVQAYGPASRATHIVAGIEHELPNGLALNFEVYQKAYHSLMPRFANLLDPIVLLPDLQVDRGRIDATRAISEGAEVTLANEMDAKGARWWLSYAWSQARDRRDEGYVPREWDQTHSLKGGLNWDWRSWNFSAAGSLHTGWPSTEIIVTPLPDGTGGSTFDVVLGPQNAERYAVFHSLDFRASRDINVRVGELNAFVEVTNLYNRENPCCTEFERYVDENGNDVLRLKGRGWLPIIPSIGVLWTF